MKLSVQIRQGEKAAQLRKEGLVPAVVYGKHMKSPLMIACKKNDFIKRFKEAGYSTTLDLEGKGVEELVLVQDIQVDPVTSVLIHVDFLAVSRDEKVTTEVPLILVGEAPVEKLGEGKVQLIKDFIEVEAFPQDLPHDIKIDISIIQKAHDTIFVKDLKLSDKVKVLDDMEQPVVTVLELTEEKEEEPTVATDAAAAGATPAAGAAAAGATPSEEKK